MPIIPGQGHIVRTVERDGRVLGYIADDYVPKTAEEKAFRRRSYTRAAMPAFYTNKGATDYGNRRYYQRPAK